MEPEKSNTGSAGFFHRRKDDAKYLLYLTVISIFPLLLVLAFLSRDHFNKNEKLLNLVRVKESNPIDDVKKLVYAGADVNYKNKEGISAFHYAVMLHHPRLVEFMIQNSRLQPA